MNMLKYIHCAQLPVTLFRQYYNENIVKAIRFNNPGNIERSQLFTWQGETDFLLTTEKFCVFDTVKNGQRALLELLGNYQWHDNCITPVQFINRFAPRNENNVQAYIDDVVFTFNQLLNDPTDEIYSEAHLYMDDQDTRIYLAIAITHHETGIKLPELMAMPGYSYNNWVAAWIDTPNQNHPDAPKPTV